MTTFIVGIFFGIIGLGFLSYGKKQNTIVPLLTGIALLIFPYFISNLVILIIIGIILVAIPFLIKR